MTWTPDEIENFGVNRPSAGRTFRQVNRSFLLVVAVSLLLDVELARLFIRWLR